MKKKTISKIGSHTYIAWCTFFLLAWTWAAWWMGDVLRIAYERSFFSPDTSLMHWLWQQNLGFLWIIGRALLTLYRWPLVGGLLVATMLTASAGLFSYCLRLNRRWLWIVFLPATAWMSWTADSGLNLYYMREPGRILAWPFLFMVVGTLAATAAWITLSHRRKAYSCLSNSTGNTGSARRRWNGLAYPALLLLFFLIPTLLLHFRHPYLRPLTRMQVLLMQQDYQGMSDMAHEHADLSYRQLAGYYAIALERTGRLADQIFDIKYDFEAVHIKAYNRKPSGALNYHLIDCNFHAGLFRAARHQAILDLTMDGPSLYTLKYLAKISLIEGDWALARKFIRIISRAPFEEDFVSKYQPMVGRADLVQADPELAAILYAAPPYHVLENMYEKPAFLGYYVAQRHFKNPESLIRSAVACLYSKRMPDFLRCCQQLVGRPLPRSIAEGLLIMAGKEPGILRAFPQLQMDQQRYALFLQEAAPYMEDREQGSKVLFEKYRGYYPFYYFFGNIRAAHNESNDTDQHFNAGVN